ncbi:MAG: hypothetical protein H0W40_08980 [Methylibium sp.]|uniref:hypothetical protein n=1 Tax=Methylibium sp. TaxID=2067992 RepID=UPI00179F10DF|nr:hypothetical protein [Methylibium sp.]MBA3597499.1 hypothetical protein [Methylibium sp.]
MKRTEKAEATLRRLEVRATEDAAKSAKTSARWAILAALVAVAALVVAAWPEIKDLGR